MTSYNAWSLSNYFKVKDFELFKVWAENLGLKVWKEDDLVRFGSDSSIPSFDKESGTNFDQELAQHIVDGWVAVYIEIGYEGQMSMGSFAVAVNSKGDTRMVETCSIFDLAEEIGNHIEVF
ncbi:MAG: hypothetical protein ACFFD4_39215 [Candidatus Odinarchaeota archaeon]